MPGQLRRRIMQAEERLTEAFRELDRLLEEMIRHQRQKVLRVAREYFPQATPEDIMNPQDIEALRSAPTFHFEDGILAGLISAQIAVRAGVIRKYES